jgi:hypothetical protein
VPKLRRTPQSARQGLYVTKLSRANFTDDEGEDIYQRFTRFIAAAAETHRHKIRRVTLTWPQTCLYGQPGGARIVVVRRMATPVARPPIGAGSL